MNLRGEWDRESGCEAAARGLSCFLARGILIHPLAAAERDGPLPSAFFWIFNGDQKNIPALELANIDFTPLPPHEGCLSNAIWPACMVFSSAVERKTTIGASYLELETCLT